MHVGDSEFVVQMWAGGPTCATNEADDLSLLDPALLTEPGSEAVQMAICGRVFFRVAKHQKIAVAALLADKLDRAVGGGEYVCTYRGRIVYPLMRAPFAQ